MSLLMQDTLSTKRIKIFHEAYVFFHYCVFKPIEVYAGDFEEEAAAKDEQYRLDTGLDIEDDIDEFVAEMVDPPSLRNTSYGLAAWKPSEADGLVRRIFQAGATIEVDAVRVDLYSEQAIIREVKNELAFEVDLKSISIYTNPLDDRTWYQKSLEHKRGEVHY